MSGPFAEKKFFIRSPHRLCEAVESFVAWVENGMLSKVKSFAVELQEIRSSAEPEVMAARARLRELVAVARGVAEDLAKDDCCQSFTEKFVASEWDTGLWVSAPDAEESDDSYSRNQEFLELISVAVVFADDLVQCAEASRSESALLEELRKSVELSNDAAQLAKDPLVRDTGKDAPISGTLVKWSEAYTRKERLVSADGVLRKYKNLMSWLGIFRKGGFQGAILHFLNEHISLPVLCSKGVVEDAGFMSTARQRLEALPPTAVEALHRARAFEMTLDF